MKRRRSCAVILLCLASATAQLRAGPGGQGVREVIIVFKTHFDIGYTDLAANVVQRYRTSMIDQALRVCDLSRDLSPQERFIWTLPGWPLQKILDDWPGQTPERKGRVLGAFKEGRFAVHALPFTTHTETLEIEDLVRGMGFASRLSREAGLPLPRDAKMTDVPCHTWLLPTLLKHAGVDFLHLGCNAASSSPRVPALFWWEGPDGSRLLTMYSAAGYGTGLEPPEDWPYGTWLALIHTGDNQGPPAPDEVRKLLAEAKRKLPGVTVRIGRLSDFADGIIKENPDVPIIRGDMPDTWIHGPMCDPAGEKIARSIRPSIAAAEALATHLRAWGVSFPDVSGTIASAYEKSLLYGEHTWGGALYWVTEYVAGKLNYGYGDAWKADRARGRFRRLEDSWAEHTSYIEVARDLILPVLADALPTLARSVGVPGKRVVVFNPLPWRRSGLVTIPCDTAGIAALKPADGTEAVGCDLSGGTLSFFARDVPAMGYRTFVPASAPGVSPQTKADEKEAAIESPHFRAVLDPARCLVRSLVEKRSGRELVDDCGPQGFGQYLYERFDAGQVKAYVKAYTKISADWAVNELGKPSMPPAEEAPYRAASPKGSKLRFEESASSVAAVMEAAAGGGIPHAVTTRVVLHRDQPCVDLEVTLHEKPADPWPEAGWLCFPLRVEEPRFRLGRLSSIVDPARDLVPGSNHDMMWLNGGLVVMDPGGRGAGLCPLDHALVSLDRPGCWKYSTDFTPRRPIVFVNLFNNQWTTNFRLWSGGTWTSRVRIWAVESYEPESSLVTPSWEARFPLLAAALDGEGGPLPDHRTGLEISRRGVMVTAFGPNPDGDGLVLRLWELAGRSGPCEVRLPAGLRPDRVQPIDLRGQAVGASVPVRDGKFTMALQGFAPACVSIR